mgnify:CR=1 FL=1
MIVFEDGIQELVEQIPAIDGFTPSFHWGSQDELNRYIALKEQPYPLVWLVSGNETHSTKDGEITRDCRFIVAVRELEHDQLNDYRLKKSFLNFLDPLAARVVEGLQKLSITSLPDESFRIQKYPNYSESGENKTIDLWDAITIDCKVQMIDNCIKQIKWQNQ